MVMTRRATDAASHAHRRADDPEPRLHCRWGDPQAPSFIEEYFTEGSPMQHEPKDDSCAMGAFVGALAGCFIGALVILAVLMLGGQ